MRAYLLALVVGLNSPCMFDSKTKFSCFAFNLKNCGVFDLVFCEFAN